MSGGGYGIGSSDAAPTYCLEEAVATNLQRQSWAAELPVQQINQSKYVRKTPAVEAAETLLYKCAQIAYKSWKGTLVETWNAADDGMCVLYR